MPRVGRKPIKAHSKPIVDKADVVYQECSHLLMLCRDFPDATEELGEDLKEKVKLLTALTNKDDFEYYEGKLDNKALVGVMFQSAERARTSTYFKIRKVYPLARDKRKEGLMNRSQEKKNQLRMVSIADRLRLRYDQATEMGRTSQLLYEKWLLELQNMSDEECDFAATINCLCRRLLSMAKRELERGGGEI